MNAFCKENALRPSIRNLHRSWWLTSLTGMVIALIGLAACHVDPNVRKQKYYDSGMRYSAQGKYNEAAIQFSNALKSDKNFAEAHLGLARAYVHVGQYGGAYAELTKAVSLQPSNFSARIELGNLLIAAGNVNGAQEQANSAAALQPDAADLHALLSAIAMRKGQTEQARKELQRAIALDPQRSEFHEDLALIDAKDPANSGSVEDELKRAVSLDSKSVEPRLILAGFYAKAARWADAEKAIRDAIAVDSKSPQAREALAQVFLRQGDQGKAEEVLRAAANDFAKDQKNSSIVADYYERTGQFDKSKSEFAALAGKYPNNLQFQEGYVRSLLQIKDYATAGSVISGLLKKSPSDPHLLALNGIVLLHDGRAEDAVSALQSAAREYPDDTFNLFWLGKAAVAKRDYALGEKSFRRVVDLAPSRIDALEELANIATQRGDMQLLSEVADKTIKGAPRFPLAYVWQANAEINRNETDDAESSLKMAMSIAPQNATPYLMLGELRLHQNKYPEGVTLVEQALQLDPNSIEAMRILVAYDLSQKHPEKALARINAQIAKSPQSGRFYGMLSQLQAQAGNLEAASAAAQKAVQLNSADPLDVLLYAQIATQRGEVANAVAAWQKWSAAHPTDAGALALLGMLEESRGNRSQAELYYKKSLQIRPGQPVAANNLAYMMLQNGGNVDVALSLAQIAQRGMQGSTSAADTLAWAYYHKGAYAFARDLLEDAVKKEPNNPTLQFHLGMVYSELADKNKAALHLKRAIILAPTSSSGRDAKTALEALG
jgi:tetratricopeptide (TPR) repeat protein